jgi:phenylalanyl-tRNA synthetase alpha chain
VPRHCAATVQLCPATARWLARASRALSGARCALPTLTGSCFITTENLSKQEIQLTKDGEHALTNGSPEAIVLSHVPAEGGILQEDLAAAAGATATKIGLSKAIERKWLQVVKEAAPEPPAGEAAAADGEKKKKPAAPKRVMRLVGSAEDVVRAQLEALKAGSPPSDAELQLLKKRSMVSFVTVKSLSVKPGAQFGHWGKKACSDITHEMLVKGSWKESLFKPVNIDAGGLIPQHGALHPLMKVRSMFRETFIEMGFEEMETDKFVESSFWNFDALFQPQQHPARDAHDTFFIKTPAATLDVPKEYMERVKTTHENGGRSLPSEYNAESCGWQYDWSEDESRKNLLRTHTTAASSRTLYKIAQLAKAEGGEFKPQKYFSIDRVFRNEALDATHLAEFHQVEGFIIDKNLSLGNLMGIIADFYRRLGPEFNDLKFKPTYNPYTEPSMEFYSYHEGLGKWVEVGNSGVFRPEMLRPMGFPPDVSVIAWGMSLERPTMIKYGYSNIRDLFGHRIDLNMTRSHPIVRWT